MLVWTAPETMPPTLVMLVGVRQNSFQTTPTNDRGPRIIAVAGNRGRLWGEQHRIETRTKRNHSRVNSRCLTIGGNYSRSPEGYWNRPEATREVIDAQNWMHTGDVGEWQNGNLRLIDRARDFLVTSGGKTISPSTIESVLRASPYIAEAIVFGHGRKYLTALIEID